MRTWDDYKEYAKSANEDVKKDIEEMEYMASLVSAVIKQRNDLGLSQRELALICGIPQSSIARFESCATIPKLDTVLKIIKPLGLKLTLITAE